MTGAEQSCVDPGPSDADLQEFIAERPEAVAVPRVTVARQATADIIDHRRGGPWNVPGHPIPELNKKLKGAVVVVAQHDQIRLERARKSLIGHFRSG
jgi:hypothetical protein